MSDPTVLATNRLTVYDDLCCGEGKRRLVNTLQQVTNVLNTRRINVNNLHVNVQTILNYWTLNTYNVLCHDGDVCVAGDLQIPWEESGRILIGEFVDGEVDEGAIIRRNSDSLQMIRVTGGTLNTNLLYQLNQGSHQFTGLINSDREGTATASQVQVQNWGATTTGTPAANFGALFSMTAEWTPGSTRTLMNFVGAWDGSPSNGDSYFAIRIRDGSGPSVPERLRCDIDGVSITGDLELTGSIPQDLDIGGILCVDEQGTGTTPIPVAKFRARTTSIVSGSGFGGQYDLESQNAGGNNAVAARLETQWVTSTDSNEDARLRLLVPVAGAMTERLHLDDAGGYVTGTFETSGACTFNGDVNVDGGNALGIESPGGDYAELTYANDGTVTLQDPDGARTASLDVENKIDCVDLETSGDVFVGNCIEVVSCIKIQKSASRPSDLTGSQGLWARLIDSALMYYDGSTDTKLN